MCQHLGQHNLLQADTYKEAKMAATNYQAAKAAMFHKFKASKLEEWVRKSAEEEMFCWGQEADTMCTIGGVGEEVCGGGDVLVRFGS